MGLAAILRGPCRWGRCRRGGSAWQPQLGRPQRVRRWVMEPGRTMPVAAVAASSAAIWAAWAWWLGSGRTVSGWHGPGVLVILYKHSMRGSGREASGPAGADPIAGYIAAWQPAWV